MRKAITGVQGRIPLHDGFQSAESPLKGQSTRLSESGPPVRPKVPRERRGGCAKRVCTWSGRCGHGRRSGSERRQRCRIRRGDELREPRPHPTSLEIEDHVLTGHASFRSWYAVCVQGRGRAERHQGDGRKEFEDGSEVPVVSWDYCFLGVRNGTSEAEVEHRGDSPVLVMHDGVTKSIFGHLIPAKGVDFTSCKKVVKMIV